MPANGLVRGPLQEVVAEAAYELKPERVDAFDGAEERGLVHELSVKNSHAVLGSQYLLRECGT